MFRLLGAKTMRLRPSCCHPCRCGRRLAWQPLMTPFLQEMLCNKGLNKLDMSRYSMVNQTPFSSVYCSGQGLRLFSGWWSLGFAYKVTAFCARRVLICIVHMLAYARFPKPNLQLLSSWTQGAIRMVISTTCATAISKVI